MPSVVQEQLSSRLVPRYDIIGSVANTAFGPANVLLKGSVIRGDYPISDVDLFMVGEDVSLTDLPADYCGIKAVYSHHQPDNFVELMRDCPRSWNGINEAITISERDGRISDFVQSHKRLLRTSLAADLAAYLVQEHTTSQRRLDIIPSGSEYYDLKRQPGSKRTIMRTVFLLQAMFPEMYEAEGMGAKLEYGYEVQKIDSSTLESVCAIYDLLGSGGVDPSHWEWQYHTGNVSEWAESVIQDAEYFWQNKMPDDYLSKLHMALRGEEPDELAGLTSLMCSEEINLPPYRHWTLLALLCSNPYTPQETLMKLLDHVKSMVTGRALSRLVIWNTNFPVEEITSQKALEYGAGVLDALKMRKRADRALAGLHTAAG